MTSTVFEHDVPYITARIEVVLQDGRTSIGTGFLCHAKLSDGTDRTLTLLISNKHVFLDPHSRLKISLNRKKADGTPDFGNVRSFEYPDFAGLYYTHPDPDVDLACINASTVTHTDAFHKSLRDDFLVDIEYDKVVPGSNVLFVGYPEGRYDVANNLPLVRTGTIASLPSVDFNGKGQIVIDAQVFQGSSGSPVFAAYDGHYRLLGVVTQTMIRHAQLQTVPANLPGLGVQQILGLGIVIKQRHVKELLMFAAQEFLRRHGSTGGQ